MSRIDTHRASYNRINPNMKLGAKPKQDYVFVKPVNGKYVVYEHKPGLEPYVWITTASLTKARLLADRLRRSAD